MYRLLFFFCCCAFFAPAYAQLAAITPPAETTPVKTYRSVHFKGGDLALQDYLAEHTVYPETARAYGLEGTVGVAFRVLPDGKLTDVRIHRSAHALLDAEALRVVRAMTDWQPAAYGGKVLSRTAIVELRFRMP